MPGLGVFDRIVMNHPHGAVGFLDVAMGASGEGTIIHLHVIGTPEEVEGARGLADERARSAGLAGTRRLLGREVRTYAPGVSHWCLDLAVGG